MQLAKNLEIRPVASLTRYSQNARTHDASQIAKIAASIAEFGFNNPILVDETGEIIAGHGRLSAAESLGLAEVPVIVLAHLTDAQRRAYVLADNRLALDAGWDDAMLAAELLRLENDGFDLGVIGFSDDELADLLDSEAPPEIPGTGDADETPAVAAREVSRTGDVWILGRHRVMCGDSTSSRDAATLMNGQTAAMVHADPPYGMGKEGDGVANDNLYREKLDAFQLEWWRAFRPHVADNGSALIWGNAPDLWRLWYSAGLGESETLEIRNEIVWDKKSVSGMASANGTSYPMATERALFFQIGEQYVGDVNTEDFPGVWAPLLGYMEAEAKAAGLTATTLRDRLGLAMFSHWFSKSQFTIPPRARYEAIQKEWPQNFRRSWQSLKAEWDAVKSVPTAENQTGRSYFDNSETMRDVWEFPRVVGAERHGHATPKPVAMMVRALNSSLPAAGLCVEPFGGSGSTLMGAELSGRACYTMELQPRYVDVIVRRWQEYTGRHAVLAETGETFATVASEAEAAA